MALNFYATAEAEPVRGGQRMRLVSTAFRRLPSPLEAERALHARRGFAMRLHDVVILEACSRAEALQLAEAGVR